MHVKPGHFQVLFFGRGHTTVNHCICHRRTLHSGLQAMLVAGVIFGNAPRIFPGGIYIARPWPEHTPCNHAYRRSPSYSSSGCKWFSDPVCGFIILDHPVARGDHFGNSPCNHTHTLDAHLWITSLLDSAIGKDAL